MHSAMSWTDPGIWRMYIVVGYATILARYTLYVQSTVHYVLYVRSRWCVVVSVALSAVVELSAPYVQSSQYVCMGSTIRRLRGADGIDGPVL